MAHNQDAPALELPRPDPALNHRERFAGTWDVTGRTLGSGQDTVSGRFTWQEPNRALVSRTGGRCRP